jgi:hypothetical protein
VTQPLDIDAGPARGRELVIERGGVLVGPGKQIPADAREVAGNALALRDALDARDRGAVTLAGESGAFFPVQPDHLHVPVIDDRR